MQATSTGPLIPRRLLGAAFRELREARNETLQQTAHACLFSPSKLSRIENGLVGEPNHRDVRDLVAHFEVDEARTAELETLAQAGRVPGWWQVPPYDMPSRADTFSSYESTATRIQAYEPAVVPGLLQTRDYSAAALTRLAPWLDSDAVALQIDIRMRRHQEHRRRDPRPSTLYAIPEAVLRRGTESPAIMCEQLEMLFEVSSEPLVRPAESKSAPCAYAGNVASSCSNENRPVVGRVAKGGEPAHPCHVAA
ncbi:MAG: helix-turn-helix domain-containing protein [Pseudonocardia sp.]|uniref:Scr1 family TA system antitoxin-like transcriptional regulator n=1 Tax=Pseudonocardia sp. TaxID=60912 RepID=UPI001AD5B10A|nr:Scr1 family TA system antitoxin-like transcriptional regulator [Pseudonocardia sp.]MBN9096841.1 helix-turn-helix domain-containing protein [Pseudonocardia sp.]